MPKLDIRVPAETAARIEAIAKAAGVKPATVVKVLLATYAITPAGGGANNTGS